MKRAICSIETSIFKEVSTLRLSVNRASTAVFHCDLPLFAKLKHCLLEVAIVRCMNKTMIAGLAKVASAFSLTLCRLEYVDTARLLTNLCN